MLTNFILVVILQQIDTQLLYCTQLYVNYFSVKLTNEQYFNPEPELLSLHVEMTEASARYSTCLQQEKPPQRETHTRLLEKSPHTAENKQTNADFKNK